MPHDPPPSPTIQLGTSLPKLVLLMNRLLAEDGCPWDREQTLDTLRPYLLEEAHEAVEAIASGDATHHCEELGDVLFQIVFQSALRAREQRFGIDDVVDAIHAKMVRRHPHVFGDSTVKDSAEVLANWEKLKAKEKEQAGGSSSVAKKRILSGVPKAMPALLRSERLGEKAARANFDWPDVAGARDKVNEEIAELDQAIASGDRAAIEEELGDVLFVLARLGTKLGLSSEVALLQAASRFESRFATVEDRVAEQDRQLTSLSSDEYETEWRRAKPKK